MDLRFGALAKPLKEQLSVAGVTANSTSIRHWQRDHDAIVRLSVRGYFTEAQRKAAWTRLAKSIQKEVRSSDDVFHR